MIIVSRHEGAIEWLSRQGIIGKVISHATIEDVEGEDVVGNLPLYLAAAANTVATSEMNLRPEQRGKDLMPDEMDGAGACLRVYKVEEL